MLRRSTRSVSRSKGITVSGRAGTIAGQYATFSGISRDVSERWRISWWWTGLDSNQRTLARADLQSAAFNHSATCPWIATARRLNGEPARACQRQVAQLMHRMHDARDRLPQACRLWESSRHAQGTQTISSASRPAPFLGQTCRARRSRQSGPRCPANMGHARGADAA